MQISRALSASDILTAWEYGRDKHAVDRALLLLALACPEASPVVLNNLAIGQRNLLLLELRRKTLGAIANSFVHCPQCEAPLEFPIDTTTLYAAEAPIEIDQSTYLLQIDDYSIEFRLPTSHSLVKAIGHGESRQALIAHCIVQAEHAGQAVAINQLPVEVITALAQAMLKQDPLAEIELSLSCIECEYSWLTVFDILAFFWAELEVQARRLLRDVDVLARAYGWREPDILALSPARRHFYLELVQ